MKSKKNNLSHIKNVFIRKILVLTNNRYECDFQIFEK